jgi:hypothetical protein
MKLTSIFMTVLVVLGIAFGYFVTWPLYQSWQGEQAKIAQLNGQLKSIKERRNYAKEIESAAATIHEKALAAKQLIPIQEDRESFISEYDAVTKQHNVSLAVLNFQKPQQTKSAADEKDDSEGAKKTTKKEVAGGGTPLGFTSTLTGSYGDIRAMLISLSRMKRYVAISSVAIISQEAGITTTVDGQIYSAPEPKVPDTLRPQNDVWSYLDQRLALPETTDGLTTGRSDPFTPYASASPTP